MKTLPKANPHNSSFKNLKPFQKNPVAYMQSAVETQGSPVDLNLPMGDFVVLNDPEQFAEVPVMVPSPPSTPWYHGIIVLCYLIYLV